MSAHAYSSAPHSPMRKDGLGDYAVNLAYQDIIMNVLKYRDSLGVAAPFATTATRKPGASKHRDTAGRHRPIPHRLYLIGCVIYNGVIAAAIGAASWAFLVLALSPDGP